MMDTEMKGRIFAVVMTIALMSPVVMIAFVLDLPFTIYKWQVITAFGCTFLALIVLIDWLLSRKRNGNSTR